MMSNWWAATFGNFACKPGHGQETAGNDLQKEVEVMIANMTIFAANCLQDFL